MSTPSVSIPSVKVQTDEKKVPAVRPQNENHPAGYIWDGLLSVRTSARPRAPPLFFSSHLASPLLLASPARARTGHVFLFDKTISPRGNFHGLRGRTKHRFRLKRNNDTGSNTMKFLPCKRACVPFYDLRSRRALISRSTESVEFYAGNVQTRE